MLWQFYYIFSKFIVTRCSPDKLITFQAFYHINKISPLESKISSTSWFNPSCRKFTWNRLRTTSLSLSFSLSHTHAHRHTHRDTQLVGFSLGLCWIYKAIWKVLETTMKHVYYILKCLFRVYSSHSGGLCLIKLYSKNSKFPCEIFEQIYNVQILGPYSLWHTSHLFTSTSPTGKNKATLLPIPEGKKKITFPQDEIIGFRQPFISGFRFSPCIFVPAENGNVCLVPKILSVKLHYVWDDVRLLKGIKYIWEYGVRNIWIKVFLDRCNTITIQAREV